MVYKPRSKNGFYQVEQPLRADKLCPVSF